MSTEPPNERTSLLIADLENGQTRELRRIPSRIPFHQRLVKTAIAEGEPSWATSYRYFLFGSWLNIFLVFVPLSLLSNWLNWDAALRFLFSFIAILPCAKLLGDATEQLSLKLGQTLSGLVNYTFGNAVEIIVGVAALLHNEIRIVQTSMLGSILSNLLLVLGMSFLAGGYIHKDLLYHESGAQASSSLMSLACITLVLPAAYHSSQMAEREPSEPGGLSQFLMGHGKNRIHEETTAGILAISRGTAIILLVTYIGYLIFQLKTHVDYFEDQNTQVEEDQIPQMNVPAACSALLLVTVICGFCADTLVASIEETARRYSIPKEFIGIILLPIVANAVEHVTSVWMAIKDKTELTIGICVGSSIQIATFVIPLLVIIGWMTGHRLTLHFEEFETITLFVSVFLVNLLIMDGRSNYMEGLMLIALYFVIALSFFVS